MFKLLSILVAGAISLSAANKSICYVIDDTHGYMYSLNLNPGGSPLPVAKKLRLKDLDKYDLDAEGGAYRSKDGMIYAFDEGSTSKLYKVNPNTGNISYVASIKLHGSNITGAAFYQNFFYVMTKKYINKINTQTWKVVKTTKMSGDLHAADSLAIDSYGRAYGMDDDDQVLCSINLETGATKKVVQIHTPGGIDAEALSFDYHDNLYVENSEDGTTKDTDKIFQINMSTGQLTAAAQIPRSDDIDIESMSCDVLNDGSHPGGNPDPDPGEDFCPNGTIESIPIYNGDFENKLRGWDTDDFSTGTSYKGHGSRYAYGWDRGTASQTIATNKGDQYRLKFLGAYSEKRHGNSNYSNQSVKLYNGSSKFEEIKVKHYVHEDNTLAPYEKVFNAPGSSVKIQAYAGDYDSFIKVDYFRLDHCKKKTSGVKATVSDTSVTEGNSGSVNAVFTVTLDKAADKNIQFTYKTKDGTAKASGSDYKSSQGGVTVKKGKKTAIFSIPVNGDTDVEPDEYFYVTISSSDSSVTITDKEGKGTIVNDDAEKGECPAGFEMDLSKNLIPNGDFSVLANKTSGPKRYLSNDTWYTDAYYVGDNKYPQDQRHRKTNASINQNNIVYGDVAAYRFPGDPEYGMGEMNYLYFNGNDLRKTAKVWTSAHIHGMDTNAKYVFVAHFSNALHKDIYQDAADPKIRIGYKDYSRRAWVYMGRGWNTVPRDTTTDGSGEDKWYRIAASFTPKHEKIKFRIFDSAYQKGAYGDDLIIAGIGLFKCKKKEDPKPKDSYFDAWEVGGSVTNHAIKTKVSDSSVTVTVASLNKDMTELVQSEDKYFKVALFSGGNRITKWVDAGGLQNHKSVNVTFATTEFQREDGADFRHKAFKDVRVVVRHSSYSCGKDSKDSESRDHFSIRPAKYQISLLSSDLHAGKPFGMNVEALGAGGNRIVNFNETLGSYDISFVDKKEGSPRCIRGAADIIKENFKNGIAKVSVNYKETGELRIKVTEHPGNEFAHIDYQDTTVANRFIAEDTKDTSLVRPSKFEMAWDLIKAGNKYTYYASEPDYLGATITVSVKAQNEDGATLGNFSKECYAENVGVKISYEKEIDGGNPTKPVASYRTPSGLKYITGLTPSKTGSFQYNIDKSKFSSGIGGQDLKFNFLRDADKPMEPMIFKVKKVEVSVSGAKSENNTEKTTEFVYARVYIPDQEAKGDEMKAAVFYELYSKISNRAKYHIDGLPESVDSIHWYRFDSSDKYLFYDLPSAFGVSTPMGFLSSMKYVGKIGVTDKFQKQMVIRARLLPTQTKMRYIPPAHLKYDMFKSTSPMKSFVVSFTPKPQQWAGKGNAGMVVDGFASRRNYFDIIDW